MLFFRISASCDLPFSLGKGFQVGIGKGMDTKILAFSVGTCTQFGLEFGTSTGLSFFTGT
jgi:hypothetical protein